ncbi:MurJ-like flippase [Planctomycetes bacterium MalM25]|nr:MurJ-like flippase [Planctomycetes bacterium MalM25]
MPEAAVVNKRARVGLRPETLASSLVLVLLVNVVQRSVGFGRAVLFCRWLEPDQLGYWEMAYGFLMLAAPLAVLGLPGSFGRYLERFRQQGQLWLFLRRTTLWTTLLAGATIGLLAWRRESVAAFVFGDTAYAGLATGVIACLGVVILHHFFEAIFAGLRMYRVVSAMHFAQSLAFAAISLALLAWWRPAAESLVIGYGAACAASILGVIVWTLLRVHHDLDSGVSTSHREFWPPLMRFAVWVWVTNLLTNVFGVVDRYMILHWGGFEGDQALVQVGNYHTSCIVPILLISVANLMVNAMTPHLSHEWEAGHRDTVSDRLNLALKVTTLAMLGAGLLVLGLSPLLFHYAFGDKYAAGLEVMPWTLTACVWAGLLLVAQQYVWCNEKSHRAAGPLVLGLSANVALNLVLLPRFGLAGAVAATAVATLLALLGQIEVNRRSGMRVHRGVWFAVFTPALLAIGPYPATAGACLLLVLAVTRGWIFTAEERREFARLIEQRLVPFARRVRRPSAPPLSDTTTG